MHHYPVQIYDEKTALGFVVHVQYTVMRLLLGYTIVLPVSVSPDKDCLFLQFELIKNRSSRIFCDILV